MGSPVDNTKSYGYAPYVWINVDTCNGGWCQGISASGFALAMGEYNGMSDMCTDYCPGSINAHWRPSQDWNSDLTKYKTEGSFLGAYVKKLDRGSCLTVPGGFKCSDRVVRDTPLNKISIRLHAAPRNRDYYFGKDPMADCGPGPQCASFKLLRRTLQAPNGTRTWPKTADVLAIRNSPYACLLSYVGLGDSESIGTCYSQLGDNCFRSERVTFCVRGNSRGPTLGITNADASASAPIAMCEISSSSSLRDQDPANKPTATEIRDFLIPSSCDAAILSLDRAVYKSNYLSVKLNVTRFHTVSEAGHVIMKVPFDECLVPLSSPALPSIISNVAETLAKVRVSTYSTAIMLDASDWGTGACSRTNSQGTHFTRVAVDLASALTGRGVYTLFLRLPRSHRLLGEIDFSQLRAFNAFVTPQGTVNMTSPGHCQNMWASGSGYKSTEGLMSYLLALIRQGVRANKVIVTLSLTGGVKISQLEPQGERQAAYVGELTLADMETNTVLNCEEDLNTKCCSGSSVTVQARDTMVNITVTSTSFEMLKRFPELVAVAFGINQFVVAPVDSDFKRGVRSNTPAILGITSAVHRLRDWKKQQIAAGMSRETLGGSHGRMRRAVPELDNPGVVKLTDIVTHEAQYKDPASGSKTCLDPQYNIGVGFTIVCPGLIATHGALGVFKEPHVEMYSTSYDKIYIVNLHTLESCTPGEPGKRAESSTRPPQTAVNINTLSPTTDRNHYMVGILDSTAPVEYAPPINKVCAAHNTGETSLHMNVVQVDNSYTVDKPVVEADHGVIVKPVEALYFVSNFTPGIDFINLNVSCINYDVSALRPCLIAICGGDSSCRKDYGRLCNSAHEIIDDARRAGEMMREGLEDLAVQETKAMMYELPDDAPFPWLDKPQRGNIRRKRFLGVLTGAAALGLAWHVSSRVDKLEAQTDSLKNTLVDVSSRLVEVSGKLNKNIALVSGRIDEQEKKIQKNNEIVNSNFAVMRDAMMRNTEAALRDTNAKFSVMASYQMWYAQMQSVTHQMTQAAMYTKFMARGVENCLRQIASKRSGSCPSGMTVMRDHPGLSDFPTVGTALYKDRKLFIVHSIPGTVEQKVVRGIIPMPRMSTDGVACWPDYKVWLIDGEYYEPSECHGKYCHKPERHQRYQRCVKNPSECKTVCAPCHRGICYQDRKVTWMEGSAAVEIASPPLKPFSRPHISDGPVSFSDLLKNSIPGIPEMELLQAINTSVKLINVQGDLDNVTRTIQEFDKRYDDITASRVTFGGWLSGFASDMALWTSVAILMAWCTALSAGIGYMYFCGGGGGLGGGGVVFSNYKKRPKML